jgi:hypothetical protein
MEIGANSLEGVLAGAQKAPETWAHIHAMISLAAEIGPEPTVKS